MKAASDSGDNDPVVLSDSTLSTLNTFLAEQQKARHETQRDPFAEDWGMSQVRASKCLESITLDGFNKCFTSTARSSFSVQFWYTDETAEMVANEVVRVSSGGRIACLACPSLFRKLTEHHPAAKAFLFEYDSRFEVDFIFPLVYH